VDLIDLIEVGRNYWYPTAVGLHRQWRMEVRRHYMAQRSAQQNSLRAGRSAPVPNAKKAMYAAWDSILIPAILEVDDIEERNMLLAAIFRAFNKVPGFNGEINPAGALFTPYSTVFDGAVEYFASK